MPESGRVVQHDRRRIGRPRDGDERPCGLCGDTLRFDEDYVLRREGVSTPEPRWICRCGQEIFVRQGARADTGVVAPVPAEKPLPARIARLRELRRILAEVRVQARAQRDQAISLRERARAALANAQRAALVGAIALDDDGRYLAVTSVACTLTGYSKRELAQLNVWDITTAGRVRRTERLWLDFLRTGHFEGQCQLRRKSGERVDVECVADAQVSPGMHVAAIAPKQVLRAIS